MYHRLLKESPSSSSLPSLSSKTRLMMSGSAACPKVSLSYFPLNLIYYYFYFLFFYLFSFMNPISSKKTVKEDWKNLTGINLLERYGMSETGFFLFSSSLSPSSLSSFPFICLTPTPQECSSHNPSMIPNDQLGVLVSPFLGCK